MFIELDSIFNEFISVIQENDTYVIGLLNTDAQVVTCSDRALVGKQFSSVSNDAHNVFYRIIVKQHDYGYLWVMGNDSALKMISGLLYDSLSTRILYEYNERILSHKVTKDDTLIKYLLASEYQSMEVSGLVKELSLSTDCIRTALLIVRDRDFTEEEILSLKLRENDQQIIFSLLDAHSFLIFKDIPLKKGMYDVVSVMDRYIRGLKEWGLKDAMFYVGSGQQKLNMYKTSYAHAVWLKKAGLGTLGTPVYFESFDDVYLLSQIDNAAIEGVFNVHVALNKGIRSDEIIEIADALIANDYNITRTAEALFLHKNTLIYRIRKFEEVFNIDIRNSFRGKILFALITKNLKDKADMQIGETL